MRDAIVKAFFDYTVSHEGYTPFMYADTRNLVTTGVGNLIDNGPPDSVAVSDSAMAPAMGLPWKHKGPGWTRQNPTVGAPATPEEIRAAWTHVKTLSPINADPTVPAVKKKPGMAYANDTDLTLSIEDIEALVTRTRLQMENKLKTVFRDYEDWPADAQIALLTMSWAMGPENLLAQFGNLRKALTQNPPDFAAASNAVAIRGFGDINDPKSFNGKNRVMFLKAADVQANGGDRDTVFFNSGAVPSGGPNPTPSIQAQLGARLSGSGTSSAGMAPVAQEPSSIVKSAAIVGLGVGVAYAGWKYGWPWIQSHFTKKASEP